MASVFSVQKGREQAACCTLFTHCTQKPLLLQKPLVGLWVININMSGVVLQAVLAHGDVFDVLASLQLMLTA